MYIYKVNYTQSPQTSNLTHHFKTLTQVKTLKLFVHCFRDFMADVGFPFLDVLQSYIFAEQVWMYQALNYCLSAVFNAIKSKKNNHGQTNVTKHIRLKRIGFKSLSSFSFFAFNTNLGASFQFLMCIHCSMWHLWQSEKLSRKVCQNKERLSK